MPSSPAIGRAYSSLMAAAVMASKAAMAVSCQALILPNQIFAAMEHGDDRYAVKLTVEQTRDGAPRLIVNSVEKLHKLHDMHLPKKMPAEGAFGETPEAGASSLPNPEMPILENAGTTGTRNRIILRDLLTGLKDEGGSHYIPQFGQGIRGSIRMGDGERIITLARKADASTFRHETGHQFLDELVRDAADPTAGEQLRADARTVLDWLGAGSREALTVEQHKKWARGLEAYAMEGRAPSAALARVFRQFKVWLTGLYKTLTALNARINDEIRGVMDRLFASEDAIANARREIGFEPLFKPSIETETGKAAAGARPGRGVHAPLFESAKDIGMTEPQYRAYLRLIKESRDLADHRVMAAVTAKLRRERTQAWQEESAALRPEVEAALHARPDLQALRLLQDGRSPADGTALPAGSRVWKLSRGSPRLTAAMAARIKLMASVRPDLAQHQIAAELDINQGRVSEVLTGKRLPEVQPSA